MLSYLTPDALFLAPPHSHDPCDVSHVASLPQSMLDQLPESVQNALWTLQESTSIVYASYVRLQELLEERFDRLVPLPFATGSLSRRYSEGAYFNYVNHFAAEQRYLIEDAFPDWRHKASRTGLKNYHDLNLTFRGEDMTIAEWFTRLHTAVTFWCHEARATELPDFDTTVLEYQSQTNSPSSDISVQDSEDLINQPVKTARKPVDAEIFELEVARALAAL